ncbi:uncharacterized protein NEMAJ01_1706 [Nematocida major]|uniref:uncharacterized protein n=1 Tax=Nematocida major TaxID=1912982 RepID=UPI002008B48C|nr:uncharacterized protein NEMAJ01_1706 [Nematocida major]KAH9386810.1 hypothetical protein NEMAJ01_1706 [Nematocida major]
MRGKIWMMIVVGIIYACYVAEISAGASESKPEHEKAKDLEKQLAKKHYDPKLDMQAGDRIGTLIIKILHAAWSPQVIRDVASKIESSARGGCNSAISAYAEASKQLYDLRIPATNERLWIQYAEESVINKGKNDFIADRRARMDRVVECGHNTKTTNPDSMMMTQIKLEFYLPCYLDEIHEVSTDVCKPPKHPEFYMHKAIQSLSEHVMEAVERNTNQSVKAQGQRMRSVWKDASKKLAEQVFLCKEKSSWYDLKYSNIIPQLKEDLKPIYSKSCFADISDPDCGVEEEKTYKLYTECMNNFVDMFELVLTNDPVLHISTKYEYLYIFTKSLVLGLGMNA